MKKINPKIKQAQYYKESVKDYDLMHLEKDNEHILALNFLNGMLDYIMVKSILDVGAGTGRALLFFKKHKKDIKIIGIEPVLAMRKKAIENGLDKTKIFPGVGEKINFKNDSFDMVTAFAILHHSPTPEKIIKEMLRVAKVGIFISDTNNYGEGSTLKRRFKIVARYLGLWPLVNFINTMGRGYRESAGDGISYSFSIFDYLPLIQKECQQVYLVNTKGGPNALYDASHVGILGIKK